MFRVIFIDFFYLDNLKNVPSVQPVMSSVSSELNAAAVSFQTGETFVSLGSLGGGGGGHTHTLPPGVCVSFLI